MSMSSLTDINFVDLLNFISTQFNAYFAIVILLFGTIGNLLNCLVLSQRSLRSNPCAFLFLASSIANFISIFSGLTTRILAGWNLDFTITNNTLCKCRVYIMFVSRTTAFWLIALATVDRWCSSCTQYKRRRFSSLRNAQRGTMIVILFSSVIYCQLIYCYDANLLNAPLRCYGKTAICRLMTDLMYAFVTVLCPLSIMSIFGIMTISNIRQSYQVILKDKHLLYNNEYQRENSSLRHIQCNRVRKLDRYLRHVIFIQIFFLAILTIPQVIEKLYTTLTMHHDKSILHITIDRFIYNFVLLLTYVASGIPFYIYTLSGGSVFRNALVNLFRAMCRIHFC